MTIIRDNAGVLTIDVPAVTISKFKTQRASTNEWYFPQMNIGSTVRTEMRNKREWSEGWVCQFSENGLTIDTQLYQTPEQKEKWSKFNAYYNIEQKVDSETEQPAISLGLDYQFGFYHDPENTENVREAVNIAVRFGASANDIESFQFHFTEIVNNVSVHRAFYGIQFYRVITSEDRAIINSIEQSVAEWAQTS